MCVCHSFLGPSVFPSGDSNIGSIGGKPTDSLHRVALVLTTYFSSRYWRTQGGKEYKWKRISQYRMEVRPCYRRRRRLPRPLHRSNDNSVSRQPRLYHCLVGSQRAEGRILRKNQPQTRRPHAHYRSHVHTNPQPNGRRSIMAVILQHVKRQTPLYYSYRRCSSRPLGTVSEPSCFPLLLTPSHVYIHRYPLSAVTYDTPTYEKRDHNQQWVTSRHKHNNISQNHLRKCDERAESCTSMKPETQTQDGVLICGFQLILQTL